MVVSHPKFVLGALGALFTALLGPTPAEARETPITRKSAVQAEAASPSEPDTAASTPRPNEPQKRTHFVRLGLGTHYLSARAAGITASGFGPEVLADMQFRIGSKLYVGGTMDWGFTVNPSFSTEGESVPSEDTVFLRYSFGPHLAYYFEGDRGLQVLAFAGLSGVKLMNPDVESKTEWGPTLAAGLGYDFSLSQQVTLGLELRGTWAHIFSEGASTSLISPTLALACSF